MPIRINLLAEALAEEDLRRRDPVKRAIYAGAFLVVLSLVWFSSTWLEFMVDKQNLNHVEAEIQTHTNDYAQVQSNLKRISDIQNRMAALDNLSAARFLQGNLLNAMQQTYVPNVQLSHLSVQQNSSASAAVPAKTNSFGVVPGRPAGIREHVLLAMDARDFSANPGDQINHFKDALLKQDYFNTCLASNGVRLTGTSPLETPPDSKPFVLFSLECRFADRP